MCEQLMAELELYLLILLQGWHKWTENAPRKIQYMSPLIVVLLGSGTRELRREVPWSQVMMKGSRIQGCAYRAFWLLSEHGCSCSFVQCSFLYLSFPSSKWRSFLLQVIVLSFYVILVLILDWIGGSAKVFPILHSIWVQFSEGDASPNF